MSVARLHDVRSARKDQGHCGRCGAPLPAGSAYRWFAVGFRGRRQVRCTAAACYPNPSERESTKVAEVLAAQEEFDPDGAMSRDELDDLVNGVAETAREVAGEYRDAAEAMGGAGYDMEERADQLESAADELEQWGDGLEDEPEEEEAEEVPVLDDDGDDGDDGPADNDYRTHEEKVTDWLEEAREAARDAVWAMDLP